MNQSITILYQSKLIPVTIMVCILHNSLFILFMISFFFFRIPPVNSAPWLHLCSYSTMPSTIVGIDFAIAIGNRLCASRGAENGRIVLTTSILLRSYFILLYSLFYCYYIEFSFPKHIFLSTLASFNFLQKLSKKSSKSSKPVFGDT